MNLEFPEIDEAAVSPAAIALVEPAAAPAALDLSKINITDIALAQFGQAERDVAAAEKALKDVQHDLGTPKKLADAISLRERLVNKPRAEARKVSKALKSKLTSVASEVTAREGEIVADFARVEAYITPQIDARNEEIEREKERDEARKADHVANIAKIAAMLNGAEDKSAERLAKGIQIVDGLLIEGFEEFQAEAEAKRTLVLTTLKTLHQKALDREAAEKLLAVQKQLLEIGSRVAACATLPTEQVRLHMEQLDATVYADGTDEAVLKAHGEALVQVGLLLAKAEKADADAAELAKLRAAQVPAPVPPAPAPEPAAAPVQHQQDAPPLLDLQPAEAVSSTSSSTDSILDAAAMPPAGYDVAGEYSPAADAALEGAPSPVAPAVVMDALAQSLPAHRVEPVADALLADARALVDHALAAWRDTRFPSHPKPGQEWFATLRERAEKLQRQIGGAA